MTTDERLALFSLVHAVSAASHAIGLALQSLHALAAAHEDSMPDPRFAGGALISVGCLFERLGIPAVEVQP